MATDVSPAMEAAFGFRRQPVNHLLVRAAPARALARKVARRLSRPGGAGAPVQVDGAFEAVADGFRRDGWAFIDPFLTGTIDRWPDRCWFDPALNIQKSYDLGFRWRRDHADPNIEAWPDLAVVYETLRSDAFAARVTQLCGDGITRSCYSIVATDASAGSALIPHRDSIATEPDGGGFLNIIVFIGGTDGGTAILSDASYDRPIFAPTNLTNTALIYKSADQAWHGFPPMGRGTWRRTINAQYAP